MIYWKLLVTDQSIEVSRHDKNCVPCPMGFTCPCPGVIQRKINLPEKIGKCNMFAVEEVRMRVVCVWGGGGVQRSRLRCFYL